MLEALTGPNLAPLMIGHAISEERPNINSGEHVITETAQRGGMSCYVLRRPRAQSTVFSTLSMVSKIRSIWFFSTMSGGESAIVSAVTLMSTPSSKHLWKASVARAVGAPGRGSNSMPATIPRLRRSITWWPPLSDQSASSQ